MGKSCADIFWKSCLKYAVAIVSLDEPDAPQVHQNVVVGAGMPVLAGNVSIAC